MESPETNPYRSPSVRERPTFVWSRVPYALSQAWRGYVAEMRNTGTHFGDHLVFWVFALLLTAIVIGLSTAGITYLLRTYFPLPWM